MGTVPAASILPVVEDFCGLLTTVPGRFSVGPQVSWTACVSLMRFVCYVRIGIKPEVLARQGPTFYALAAWILKLDVIAGVEDGSLSFSADEAMLS